MQATTVAPGVAAAPEDMLFRGNPYAEGVYLKTDVPKGVTRNRMGTRIVSLSEDFLRGLRRALGDECGPAADTVLKSCGRRLGGLVAKRVERELSEFYGQPLQEFSTALFLGCLTEMFSQHGWGRLDVDLSRAEEGLLIADLNGAIMAGLVQQADVPVDALMAGLLGGFFAHLTGQDLDCVQTACQACGAATSRFVIGLRQRLANAETWVQDGKTHEDVVAALAEVRG